MQMHDPVGWEVAEICAEVPLASWMETLSTGVFLQCCPLPWCGCLWCLWIQKPDLHLNKGIYDLSSKVVSSLSFHEAKLLTTAYFF